MKLKKYAHGIVINGTHAGEVGILNSEIPGLIAGLREYYPDQMNQVTPEPLVIPEEKCQCGLDEPCEQGHTLAMGTKCSAGFAACYISDEPEGDEHGPA